MVAYALRDGVVHSTQGLEVNVVAGCNLSCASCSHLSPVLSLGSVDRDVLAHDLGRLARVLRPAFVKLVGGEPLLHRDLAGIVALVRGSGITDDVRVCSNGLLADHLDTETLALLELVEISVYPGANLDVAELDALAARCRATGTELVLDERDDFRLSYSEVGTDDDALVTRIFRTCEIAHTWGCITVLDGRVYRCSPAYYLRRAGTLHDDPEVDSIAIADVVDDPRRLLDYLERDEPLAACRSCLGTAGRRFAHHQLAARDWRSPQERPSEDLVDEQHMARLEVEIPRRVAKERAALEGLDA